MKKIVFTLIGILSAIIVNSQVSQDSALAILRTNIAVTQAGCLHISHS